MNIPGCETIWVIRDKFIAESANQYFKLACNTLMKGSTSTGTYCGDHFEIKLFHATSYNSYLRDFMARICNTFAEALNKEKELPRAIIIVLNDDMIKYINLNGYGISMAYGRLLHYVFSEFNKMIATRKDQFPLKATREHFPELLWINLPFHSAFTNNGQRNKFTKAMDTTVAIYADNWSLQLKRIWDTQGRDLYLDQAKCYSAKGLMTYWMAVDRTIKFWDTALSPIHKLPKNQFNKGQNIFGGSKRGQCTNKFSWKKNKCF